MINRQIAHIIIEADTPLKVGSNSTDILQDSPIQRDFNNLPMILGTSIAGVLRKDFDILKVDDVFGKDDGSKIIISNALLLDEDMKVNENLLLNKSNFLKLFDNLPIREHTAITDKGVAKEHSKFDEEVLYKGSRFKFSIEYIENNQDIFNSILELITQPSFRLGGGTSKGFGKFKILEITTENFNKESYHNFSSSLNYILSNKYTIKNTKSDNFIYYNLNIIPDNFFMFGAGFGDEDADMTPVYESIIDYNKKDLSKKQILIPATSIKGALAHRTAFYYNKLIKVTIGDEEAKVGEDNIAVKTLFGEKKDTKKSLGQKGKILFSDCFKSQNDTKVFDHISIDRFTGGGIDGALFQEKTIADDREYQIEILLKKDFIDDKKENIIKAFELSLKDICNGMLPLGGATTKGHGIFTGTLLKDGVNYEVK
jgi:CRISPR/Cas system CSM-associated protein Csm3 (group 7 of RAMP superfamily)